MAKVCLASNGFKDGKPCWSASDDESVEALAGVTEIIFDYKKKRNAGNHRRYFVFIKTAFDMQDFYDNTEIFRKYIEMRAGHFDTIISANTGETMYIPKSISWEKLDEIEFRKLFNEVVNAFMKSYKDMTGHQLNDMQINQLLSF